jgi:hypothetical protein
VHALCMLPPEMVTPVVLKAYDDDLTGLLDATKVTPGDRDCCVASARSGTHVPFYGAG